MISVDCVFCELMSSGDGRWVAREDDAVAFMPLPDSSLAPGHTLVVPRQHFIGVQDTDPAALHATVDLVQRVSRAMSFALGASGVVVLNASGPYSGQSVAHLHFHVVPCWADDQALFWPGDRSTHVIQGEPHHLLAAAFS